MSVEMDRRQFVGVTACGLLAVGFAGCASLQAFPVPVRNGRVRVSLAAHPQLAASGGFLRIQPAGLANHLVILRLEDDEAERYAVVSPVCTHRGCIVDVAGARMVCPCHGSEYDRTGRVLEGPAEFPLERYPSRLTDSGDLVIELEPAE